jgi:hypothetical protein
MKSEESAVLVASFSIDVWREDVALDVERCKIVRTHLEKTFRGALVGTSVGEMTMGHAGDGNSAYMGFERFDVSVRSPGHALDGRRGQFTLLHHAVGNAASRSGTWVIQEGSGVGELLGLSGTAQIERHDDGSHTFTLHAQVST